MEIKKKFPKQHNYSFDFLRVTAMLGVVLYHSAAAYSFLSPYWAVQDTQHIFGDVLREWLVVFIMPFFFFTAGFFVLPSLRNDTTLQFIWKKIKRLGVYWIFAVLIIIPFFNSKTSEWTGTYFDFWIGSLLSFRDARVGPMAAGQSNNMHFWFISLLLYVDILFAVAYKIIIRFRKSEPGHPPAEKLTLSRLAGFALLTTAVDFLLLVFVPDANWIIVPNVIQVSVIQLPTMLLYFAFGMYAKDKGWFAVDSIPLTLRHWLGISFVATAAYFILGQEFFARLLVSNTLPPVYLFCIALIRSVMLLSYLLTAIAVGSAYFQKRNPALNELAGVSYEIYLVHLFIVVAFQMMFAGMPAIPVAVKIPAVFILSTGVSYVLGKFTIHKHPKISAAVMSILFLVMPLIFGPD
ncbi:MAG: acyltransferase [Anaerolineales bacterium]|nr:acyltransferase [Anaerolineales bacterium]